MTKLLSKVTRETAKFYGSRPVIITSAKECAESIVKNHGPDCETFKTAQAFLKERDEAVDTAPKNEDGELEDESALDEKLDDMKLTS